MKQFRSILLLFALSAILGGCAATGPITGTPLQIQNSAVEKKQELSEEELKNWAAMDLIRDTVPGMSVDRAYSELLKGRKKGKTVIVGVVDSGLDIEHEDLKNVLWINPGEIAGNGIDDDGNGFVDDVYGWNFLGDMLEDNMEFVRYVRKLAPKYEGRDEASISAADREEYELYLKAKAEMEKEMTETLANNGMYKQMLAQVKPAHEAMAARLGKEDYTMEDLEEVEETSEEEMYQIAMLRQMLNFADSVPEVLDDLNRGVEYYTGRLESHFNLEKDFRGILGDDPDDLSDAIYGDNNVMSIDPTRDNVKHGTHVSGIIAAERDNGIGMNGVANNVRILTVRAVPDGDEYDKDVALGIRYAVDNGAKVINTSFGKYYSPHPEWVYDAIRYAASKDVLIVNAAGNDGFDLDTINVYPNDQFDNGEEVADNFITVGALNPVYGKKMVAGFSNYGKINVDIFAPGVKIWATTPLDSYEFLQGTSMAAPNVAGVAAMIRSYFPDLTAPQVKRIILESGISPDIDVVLGGDESLVKPFKEISSSGKIANLYNALLMASKISNQ